LRGLEIILQLTINKERGNKRKPTFSRFITSTLSISYKQACKRASFALQKGVFYTPKGHLLHRKRASFAT